MSYKPYSPEWTRKRYLKEAIQTYFDDDVCETVIIRDIIAILQEEMNEHQRQSDKFESVLKAFE